METTAVPVRVPKEPHVKNKSKALALAIVAVVVAGLVAVVALRTMPPHQQSVAVPQGSARAVVGGEEIGPLYNTGGDHVYSSMQISETGGSGVLVTPTDGGVFTAVPPSAAVADGGVAVGDEDGSGCITASASTGLFTVNKTCGAGELRLSACIGSMNSGNTGLTVRGAWTRTRAGVATQLAGEARKIELVDAGRTDDMGCVNVLDVAQNGDTYAFTVATSGATAGTHTIKQMSLTVMKMRQ